MNDDPEKLKTALERIEKAIAGQEGLRGILPDEQIQTSLTPLIQQRDSLKAKLEGSGGLAQGDGAKAVGERGIMTRDFHGLAISGDNNIVNIVLLATEAFLNQYFPKQRSEGDLKEATVSYLAHLVETYRYLDFKGMGVSDRIPLQLSLTDMYVPLKARIELPEGETWSRDLRLAGRHMPEEEEENVGPKLSEPQPIVELLKDQDGLIVLGDPGSGKTTFFEVSGALFGPRERRGFRAESPVAGPGSPFSLCQHLGRQRHFSE